jgi:MFS family permease
VGIFTREFNLVSASYFALFTSFYFMLPTMPIFVQSVGGQDWQIGVVMATFTATSIALRPFIGREADRRGRKGILLAGLVAFTVSTALYNYSSSLPLLVPLRALHGAAWAATTTALSALAADVSPINRRGEALGYFGMFANFAMAFSPAVGMVMLDAGGFKTLFLSACGIALFSLLFASQIRESERPSLRGSDVSGKTLSRNVISPTLVILLNTFSYGSIITYLPLYAQKQSIPNIGLFFTVYAISVIMVRPVAGRLSDRYGRGAVIMPGVISVVVGLLTISLPYQLPMLLAAAVIYGLGFGAAYPTLMALAVDLVSTDERGAAVGTFMSGFDLGIALGSVVSGLILQLTDFTTTFLSAGLVSSISIPLVFLLFLRESPASSNVEK